MLRFEFAAEVETLAIHREMSDAGSDSSFDELFLASFECLSDRGWREYRFDISRAMHEAQLHGQRYVRFERDGIPYVADLERMVQTRADGVYRTERPVRDRIEFEHDPERAEGLPWRREPERVLDSSGRHVCSRYELQPEQCERSSTRTREYQEYFIASCKFSEACRVSGLPIAKRSTDTGFHIAKIYVYMNEALKRSFEHTAARFAQQGIDTQETWVFHGTSPAAARAIMAGIVAFT
jgi:WWE domain